MATALSEVLYWAYRVLGPEFKGPTIEDPLGSLPIPLKTALLQAVGEALGLEFNLREAPLTRPPNEGRSYTYAPYWWPLKEGLKEPLYQLISQASFANQNLPSADTLIAYSGKAREALTRLAESDPLLRSYLKEHTTVSSPLRLPPTLRWLVDLPAKYPVALKGAFARLLGAMEKGEPLLQVLDSESSTPLVEAAFADAYFTLLNVGRLAGVNLSLPKVRVYRLDTDPVSQAFRNLLPLWAGGLEGFSVVEGVPEEGQLEVFSWDWIASLARKAETFQAEQEAARSSWSPPFAEGAPSPLALDFFARKFFPVPELKGAQLRLLQRTLRGESGLALLPTGYGKSLVFQLYAFLVPGVNIVISPLRALMRDQVYNLQRIGVTAVTSISSDDEAATREKKTRILLEGRYRLVYLSPERIRIKGFIEEFKKELANLTVSAVTVDEAHCVSEWGHDFRPAYLHIRDFYEEVQGASQRKLPLLALTATASPTVRRDILRVLGLPEAAVEQLASSDRPNLSFSVHAAPLGTEEKRRFLVHLLTDLLPRTLRLPREELLGGTKRTSYPHAGVIFAIYAAPQGQNTLEEGVHAIRDFLVKEGLVASDQVTSSHP